MTFFENLEKILQAKYLTRSDLCEGIGIVKSSFSAWQNGSVPRADIALKIAQYLGVSVDYLLTGQPLDNELTAQEQELIKNFRVLTNDKDIELVTMLLRELVKRY